MRSRFTWIVALVVLIALGLVACSAKYASNYNGLVVVPSQGSAVMQSFSLDIGNGHIQQINNVNGPPIPGIPYSVILDPAGEFAYVIVYQNPVLLGSITGVASFAVLSDGKLGPNLGKTPVPNPTGIAMDSAGKFLFVSSNQGSIYTFSIGSNATLTEVGKPTLLPAQPSGETPSASAIAVTPTRYPSQFAACSKFTAPTTENLYVTDAVNYLLLNYSVASSGALTLVPYNGSATGIPTGTTPAGVAIDPCNRYAYVSNSKDDTVSAYTICSAVSLQNGCPSANYSLQPVVATTPNGTGESPGPLLVDPYGKFLYVLDTGSNQISGYQISSATGALTQFTGTPTVTNLEPTAIAIRSDDSWLFVSNLNSANVSEYAISPATGALAPQTPITTFNYPSGIAVK